MLRILLLALLLSSFLVRSLRAEPCTLPPIPMAELQQSLAAMSRTPPPRIVQPLSRWRGLLPVRLMMGMRNGTFDETAWYMTTTPTEKIASGTNLGWSLRMDWDLRPLWASQTPVFLPGETHLARAERAVHLAERVGAQLQTLRKAEALAMQLENGDLLCKETQAEAEAALLVLQTVLEAAKP